jgi:hypothetical protein
MACHFSPYGLGLSNLPSCLPGNSLLLLDDITPIRSHDPEVIARQLIQCAQLWKIHSILLDFQRPDHPEIYELVQYLSKALPCPIIVSEAYADAADLPVFLSPIPPSVPIQEHLSRWSGREIWLDICTGGERITLTETNCQTTLLPPWELPAAGFSDTSLHCHYTATHTEDSVRFCLWRTDADLSDFLLDAESSGVVNAVGLYQEYCAKKPEGQEQTPALPVSQNEAKAVV